MIQLSSLSSPCGLALPEGNRLGPNCGVTALSIVSRKSFNYVWHHLAARRMRPGAWKGITTLRDWTDYLAAHSIPFELMLSSKSITLASWVKRYSRPGVTYMVRTSGHVQVVRNGWVIDQGGPQPIDKFWGRRKRLSFHMIIHI